MTSVDTFRNHKKNYRFQTEDVPIPEWPQQDADGNIIKDEQGQPKPVVLTVRELTEDEVEIWYQTNQLRQKEGMGAVQKYGTSSSHLVGLALIDSNSGQNYFRPDQVFKEMRDIPRSVVDRCFEPVARLSKILPAAQEDTAKNSETTLVNDSGTGTPPSSDAA